jgi:hypothetical protein
MRCIAGSPRDVTLNRCVSLSSVNDSKLWLFVHVTFACIVLTSDNFSSYVGPYCMCELNFHILNRQSGSNR